MTKQALLTALKPYSDGAIIQIEFGCQPSHNLDGTQNQHMNLGTNGNLEAVTKTSGDQVPEVVCLSCWQPKFLE